MIKPYFFFTVLFSSLGYVSYAQDVLTGRVSDSDTGEPLPDVFVQLGNKQAVTDLSGRFTVTLTPKDTLLQLGRLGYKPIQVVIGLDSEELMLFLEPEPTQLNQVVVTSDHVLRNYQEYPANLGLILKKDLQRDQDLSIVNALNRIPGIHMQSGALNTNRITIRGLGARTPFSTNRVKAYFGEIPLTTGDGETAIEDIDMTFLERAEVIKGPNASLYGAGLGGTIRLIPSGAFNGTSYQVSQSFGSYGLNRQLVNVKNGNQKRDLIAGITHTQSDGYRQNNEYQRINGLATGNIRFGRNSLSFLGQFIHLDAQIPSSINDSTFRADPRAAAPNWSSVEGFENYQKYLLGLSYQWNTRNFTSNTSVFANLQRQEERRPFNTLEDSRNAIGLRSTWKGKIGKNSLWAAGTELFFEQYDWQTFETLNEGSGELLSDNTEDRWYQNVFAQWERAFGEKWYTIIGMNLNLTRFELEDQFLANGDLSGDRSFDPVLSPRLTVSYAPQPGIMIYSSANHGFSTPSLEETLAPDGEINPGIKPETGWSFEIGSKGSFAGKFNYQIAFYHMPIRDLLVPRRTAEDAFIGINAGRTVHNGMEIDLNKSWVSSSGNTYSLFLNYLESWYFFDEFEEEDQDFSGNELTGTPDRTLSVGSDFHFSFGLTAHINSQYIGQMPINDANTLYNDDYVVSNIKLDQEISFGDWTLMAFIGVNNIFDEKYAAMVQVNAQGFGGRAPRYFYPGLPRNYFGGMSVSFDLP